MFDVGAGPGTAPDGLLRLISLSLPDGDLASDSSLTHPNLTARLQLTGEGFGILVEVGRVMMSPTMRWDRDSTGHFPWTDGSRMKV